MTDPTGSTTTPPAQPPAPAGNFAPGFAAYDLGPDQRFVVTSSSVRLVGSPSTVEGDIQPPPDRDLTLLADTVTIFGAISAPSRRITIVARVLKSATDPGSYTPAKTGSGNATAAKAPTLDVSGNAGQDGDPQNVSKDQCEAPTKSPAAVGFKVDQTGKDGADGAKGHPGGDGYDAGSIAIFCAEADPGTAVTLLAKGGNGGNGQHGQEGQDGATGQHGKDGHNPNDWSAPGSKPTQGYTGGAGGAGGMGGDYGKGKKGGSILFHAYSPKAPLPTLTSANVAGGIYGKPGKGGKGGKGGSGGPGGHGYELHSHSRPDVPDAKQGNQGPDHSGEYAPGWGTWQNAKVPNYTDDNQVYCPPKLIDDKHPYQPPPSDVVAGTINQAPPGDTASAKFVAPRKDGTISDADLAKAMWSQSIDVAAYLEMQYDTARSLYLSLRIPLKVGDQASSARSVEALKRFGWIVGVANATIEGAPKSPTPAQAAAVSHLTSILLRAANVVSAMNLKQDYFGNPANWVPARDLDYFSVQLGLGTQAAPTNLTQGAIADLKNEEDFYTQQYQNILDAQSSAILRQRLVAGATELSDTLRQSISDKKDAAALLWEQIEKQDALASSVKTEVAQKITAWSDKIKTIISWDDSWATLSTIFNTVSQFAFVPEGDTQSLYQGAMVAGQVFNSMTSQSTVDPDLNALVGNVKVLQDDIGSLDEGFLTSSGGISLKDSDCTMLVARMQRFEALCDRYDKGGDEGHDAMDSMRRYVQAINERNQTILQYNALATQIRSDIEKKGLADKVAAAQSDGSVDDLLIPSAASRVAQLSRLKADQTEECIRLLYGASRAFSLAALKPDFDFVDIVGLDAIEALDSSRLKSAAINLVTDRRTTIDALRPGRPAPDVSGGKYDVYNRAGLLIELDDKTYSDLHSSLATTRAGSFKLSTDILSKAKADLSTAHNVRLRAIRFWVDGFSKTETFMNVQLQHLGDSTFVNDQGLLDARVHDPAKLQFSYSVARLQQVGGPTSGDRYRAVHDPDLGGGTDGILADMGFALLSPFATWKVTLTNVPSDARAKGLKIYLDLFVLYDA